MKYHYVYRITCTYPNIQQKYYYGVRSSCIHPIDDIDYWSSSTVVKNAIQEFGKKWFKKKIINIYSTREEALKQEIYLHNYFDVGNHPAFMNQSNQTSTKFNFIHTKPFPKKHKESLKRAHQSPIARARSRNRMLRDCMCPHCGIVGSRASLIYWHFDACPKNPNRIIRLVPNQLIQRHRYMKYIAKRRTTCPYCQQRGAWLNMQSNHFAYCNHNPNKKTRIQQILQCPYCDKIGFGNVMYQWHFDNCSKNPNKPLIPVHQRPILQCPHCLKQGSGGAMYRWHFDKCRYNPNRIPKK